MLSSSLYSNKELAVLYELGANCTDAHALNGNKSKPWDLVCPTTLDPTIRFRDYGPGLSEDDVYLLLTTYGESTKADSNAYIGAFGIGSKSPAAVTSNWTVISRFEGVLSEYLVFIDVNGVPSLTKIREAVATDTGLEVIIPVPPNRFYMWTDKIKVAYKHYDVRPKVINYQVQYEDVSVSFQKNNWGILKAPVYSSKIRIITTQREYTFNASSVMNEFKGEDFCALFNHPINMTINFPIGSLETSLSREDIQYTKHTIENLRTTFRQVFSELRGEVDNILNLSANRLEFSSNVYYASKHMFGDEYRVDVTLALASKNKYGITFERDLKYFTIEIEDFLNNCKPKLYNGSNTFVKMKGGNVCFRTYKITLDTVYTQPAQTKKYNLRFSISSMDQIKIVINDDKYTPSKVRHSFATKYVLISDVNVFPPELQKYVVLASTLPDDPKEKRERKILPKQEHVLYSIRKNSFIKIDSSLLSGDKIVAISFKDCRSIDSATLNHIRLMYLFRKMGYDVFAYKVGTKLPKNVMDIEEAAIKFIDEHNTDDFYVKYNQSNMKIEFMNDYSRVAQIVKKFNTLRTKDDSVFNTVMNLLKTLTESKSSRYNESYEALVTLCDIMKVKQKTPAISTLTVTGMRELLYNTYPMLKYCHDSIDQKTLLEYITSTAK